MKAIEQFPRIDLRRRRADALVAAVMRALDKPLGAAQRALDAVDHPDAYRFRREVHERLIDLFVEQGVEVLSDFGRQEMGLPPRGPDGWTPQEVHALEVKRLEVLTRPLVMPIFPSTKASEPDTAHPDRHMIGPALP